MAHRTRREPRSPFWWALPTLLVGLVLLTSSAVAATTYFVRASGDDSRDGLSPATAFASARPAARMLRNPGDRLIVGPGTYHEGNIMPRGSGTPEAPIVLQADVTGALTGDAAGPVVIVPPNTPDATTGFVVYGRHDIVIEGFAILGSADAGIQVRPHSRTYADSAAITVRNNAVRNGRRKGIHIIAAGAVSVTGNTITGNGGSGIVLKAGASAVRPDVSGNTLEANRLGITLEDTTGGHIGENTLQDNIRGLNVLDCHALGIIDNQVRGSRSLALRVSGGTNLMIVDNAIDTGVEIFTIGPLTMARNEFTNQNVHAGDPKLSTVKVAVATAQSLSLFENRLPRTVAWGGLLDIARNGGRHLKVEYAEVATLTDNTIDENIVIEGGDRVVVTGNEAPELSVCVVDAMVRDNHIERDANIWADSATATGNHASSLVLARRRPRLRCRGSSGDATGPYVAEGNEVGGLRLGEAGRPVSRATISDNTLTWRMEAYGRDELEVRHNEARGILCSLVGNDTRLALVDNISRSSAAAGLIVIGAHHGVIADNVSADNADSGLAVRASRNLTITNNTFRANPAGGISVQVPLGGDCNDDLSVNVNELTTIVAIALRKQTLRACLAADLDGDSTVTIEEIMQAIGAAFDRADLPAPRIEVRTNRIEDNGRFGIDIRAGGPVVAIDNHAVRNGGIALAIRARGRQSDTAVIGNILGSGGAEGLLLRGVLGASVRNNVIFSHREAGILLRDAPQTSVINNLIYANGDDGVSVGLGSDLPAHDVTLANNTIYANAGWGVTMGSAGAPSKGTVVVNNIIDGNLRGGVAAERDSRTGLAIDFNLNNDGNDPSIPASSTEIEGDPRFVAAAGPDGVLGGSGFADDDLHLQPGTPAIDAGSAPAADLGITGSAVAGQTRDTGVVDVGFHYDAQP